MAIEIKNELDRRGGLAYWSICGGRFEVWDRGDGIAEVCPAGSVGYVTAELVGKWNAFRSSLGQAPIEVPLGLPIQAGPIAYVHAHCEPDQDESGFCELGSAFPGRLDGRGVPSLDVADIESLEAVFDPATPA